MIFDIPPKDFSPKLHAVGCVILHQDKHLLLKRNKDKFEANTWQAPGGKIEKGESLEIALEREIFEETGLKIDKNKLVYLESYTVRYPEYDFLYEIFLYKIDSIPEILIRKEEHSEFAWVTKEEALKLPIIKDGLEVLERIYTKF